jgi:cell division protein FtsB
LWALLATVVAVVVLFVGVFPTRTFLAQRSAIARAEEQLEVLTAENERLDARADALHTADALERLAREEFDLIRPGERPYVVLDPDESGVELPAAWPFAGLAAALSRPR